MLELDKFISVVLVEPKYQGNIGAVARSMANSGISDLRIVKTPVETEAMYRSMHGRYILENARTFNTMKEAVKDFEIIAGTSDISKSGEKFRRVPTGPEDFWINNGLKGKKVALVFGREDNGLNYEELGLCNFFIKIIGNPEYPVYNLSHAVAIILYEMIKYNYSGNATITHDIIDRDKIDTLSGRIEELLGKIDYNEPEIETLMNMLNRIIARANITDSEFFKIMGILRQTLNRIK
ncbi:RNA methyltransferase [Ferroplasma acidiphilum]|jgi:TrmH family RNA methyltransferase|uniref:RNA methyltransferase n=1 Tax=Ferroplasma acidiphilum TaxID=74969 RepID=UPI0023F094BF|nr:RNA methyltransferase [Ferroplasma acidiphilum]